MVLSLSALLSFSSAEHKVISPSVLNRKIRVSGIRGLVNFAGSKALSVKTVSTSSSWIREHSSRMEYKLFYISTRQDHKWRTWTVFSTGQVTIADPKYVLFESNSRNSQRKCSERPPENVKHEFKRNHFHICLFLRFRRLILIVQEHQTISMKFDDVIKFQRNGLTNRL